MTARGKRVLRTVEGLYADLEGEWSARVGARRSLQAVRAGLEDVLAGVFGASLPPVRPTWEPLR